MTDERQRYQRPGDPAPNRAIGCLWLWVVAPLVVFVGVLAYLAWLALR